MKSSINLPDAFYAKIRRDGDSMVVTIPKNYLEYGNYKEGEEIRILIRRK